MKYKTLNQLILALILLSSLSLAIQFYTSATIYDGFGTTINPNLWSNGTQSSGTCNPIGLNVSTQNSQAVINASCYGSSGVNGLAVVTFNTTNIFRNYLSFNIVDEFINRGSSGGNGYARCSSFIGNSGILESEEWAGSQLTNGFNITVLFNETGKNYSLYKTQGTTTLYNSTSLQTLYGKNLTYKCESFRGSTDISAIAWRAIDLVYLNTLGLSVWSSDIPSNQQISNSTISLNITMFPTAINMTYLNITLTNKTGGSNTYKFNQNGEYLNNSLFIINNSYLGNNNISFVLCGSNATSVLCSGGLQNITIITTYGDITTSFDNPLLGGQSSYYEMNMSLSSINQNINAILWFNNTAYPTTKNIINSSLLKFYSNINIPSELGSMSGTNVSHYWNYYLNDNSINATTSPNQQTVFSVSFDDCSVLTTNFINFTLKDETTLVNLSTSQNLSTNVYLTLSNIQNSSLKYSFNQSYSSNPARICISSNAGNNPNFRVDAEIKYTADNYAVEYYNIQNGTLSSYPQNINLLLLSILEAQEFQIEYRDSNFLLVPNVLVQIDRQYLNLADFITVEVPKTDSDGKTIANFVLNDVLYNIYIKKDGVTIASFLNSRAFCEVAIQSCVIRLNERSGTSQISGSNLVNGVVLNNNYNLTTRIFTTLFNVPDSTSKTVSLNISKYDPYLNTSICSTTATASSGVLTCTISSSYLNQTAVADIYINGEKSSTVIFYVGDNFNFGNVKYFLALGLFITLVGLGVGNKIIVGFSIVMGVVMAGILQLVDLGGWLSISSTAMWIIILVIILINKTNKGETDAN